MSSMGTSMKARANRLRRMAERQGLALSKSRRRDPCAYDYGGYWLVNMNTNACVGARTGMSLDAVETHLTGETTS